MDFFRTSRDRPGRRRAASSLLPGIQTASARRSTTTSSDSGEPTGLPDTWSARKASTRRKVRVVSYGASKPVADNSTSRGRRTNRRVEILVYQEKIAIANQEKLATGNEAQPLP